MQRRAMVVDDEDLLRELMKEALSASGWEVAVTGDLAEARRLVSDTRFDVVIIDLNLGEQGNGLELCRELAPVVPVLLTSGLSDAAVEALGVEAGARRFLTKPFLPRELVAAVEATVSHTT